MGHSAWPGIGTRGYDVIAPEMPELPTSAFGVIVLLRGFCCVPVGSGCGRAFGRQSDFRPTLLVAGFVPLLSDRRTARSAFRSGRCLAALCASTRMAALQAYHPPPN
jgi:hypothetical protein